MSKISDILKVGDEVEIDGRHGVVRHITAQRCWVKHDGDRVATGYSKAKILQAKAKLGLHGNNMMRTFATGA